MSEVDVHKKVFFLQMLNLLKARKFPIRNYYRFRMSYNTHLYFGFFIVQWIFLKFQTQTRCIMWHCIRKKIWETICILFCEIDILVKIGLKISIFGTFICSLTQQKPNISDNMLYIVSRLCTIMVYILLHTKIMSIQWKLLVMLQDIEQHIFWCQNFFWTPLQ